MTRIVVISDLHCGSQSGLTPPGFDPGIGDFYSVRKDCWAKYIRMVKEIGKVDLVIANGDLVDGDAVKTSGIDLILPDRMEQCQAAICALKLWKPRIGYRITAGTPYHSGTREDWESLVAEALDTSLHAEITIEVDGLIIQARHHVGGSSIPHGRHTALAKERLWDALCAPEKANIIIRSHVHYHSFSGGHGWIAMTTPALQAAVGGKYGRRCTGECHWGLILIEINQGDFSWLTKTADVVSAIKRAEMIV